MNIGKKGLVILSAGSLLTGGTGFVGAQTQSGGAPNATPSQSEPLTQRSYRLGHGFDYGFGHDAGFDLGGRGFGSLPFGRLALETTVEVALYDGDPDAGGSATETLTFTYGQDSEVAFAQAFAEARENASYMVVNVGEQTQTLDLAGFGDGLGRGALPLHGLDEGGTVEAVFYDGDPAADGQALQTLSFTYGQDSAAGFADDFASAAEEAAFVTLTTSPQTYAVNLSAVGREGFAGRDNFGRSGPRHGRFR